MEYHPFLSCPFHFHCLVYNSAHVYVLEQKFISIQSSIHSDTWRIGWFLRSQSHQLCHFHDIFNPDHSCSYEPCHLNFEWSLWVSDGRIQLLQRKSKASEEYCVRKVDYVHSKLFLFHLILFFAELESRNLKMIRCLFFDWPMV